MVTDINKFGLPINPQYSRRNQPAMRAQADLRNIYSTRAWEQRMGFRSHAEYQRFAWESMMREEAVQQAADDEAKQTIMANIQNLAQNVSTWVDMFKQKNS